MGTYAVIENGVVVNVIVWDKNVDEWSAPEGADVVEYTDEGLSIGYFYNGTVFSAPPLPPVTPAETLAKNTATRDSLLVVATAAIAPLQDAVDLDDATAAETALLKKWKQYRVAVNREDLTVLNLGWPVAPT